MENKLTSACASTLFCVPCLYHYHDHAKLQGAVAVNSFEDQIATNFFAGEEEDDDIEIKENIERYSYGRMSGKSGKSIRSCTKRLLNDCYQ
jgi:hypothetical protein